MYSTHNEHNEGKSIVTERFVRTLKVKIYNNSYHHSTGKKLIDADYFALTKKIEFSHKAPKFKFKIT